MPRTVLGHSVQRTEDARHLTGEAHYADDVPVDGALHAAFVRSTFAHAGIVSVDVREAVAMPGVAAVLTAADLDLPPAQAMGRVPALARPRLATDKVRYVGEAVAVVVAETRTQAVDAAELVDVEYEQLVAVTDPLRAIEPDAPLLFPDHGSNVALDGGAPDAADLFEDAEQILTARIVHQRLAPAPLEANGCVAIPENGGRLMVWASTQSVFGVRRELARALRMDENDIRVLAPAVGGGFGAKGGVYPEQVVVAATARRLGRPVRWAETRSENLVAMTHGRGQVHDVEIGVRPDGTVTALRVRGLADGGGYAARGAFIPFVTQFMASGAYRIPRIEFRPVVALTNAPPTGPYRGAGRPEAAVLAERVMDLVAFDLGLDPVEVRRRNFVPREAFPYTTPTGAVYDSGDYERALDEALRLAGYDALRAEQRVRRERGDRRLLGIGLGCYVEVSGRGGEYGSVQVERNGTITVVTGTSPHGQGHETTWAQIASAVLGVPMEEVRVRHSDTAVVPRGIGTFGSRSLQLGGSAVHRASEAVLAEARRLAADLLEAAEEDVVSFDDGRLGVAGAPVSALSWADLAEAAAQRATDGDGRLAAEVDFEQDGTFPFGTHVAVVEVDRETGDVRLIRHVAVDDCGLVVNPLLAAGQVHGGIAQGVAQALYEAVVYDGAGNPLTTTLADYAMPAATELPRFEVAHTETPSPRNPLGAKGIGESGTTGSLPAVWNAVVDALAPFGVRHLDPPFTPERVWRAISGRESARTSAG